LKDTELAIKGEKNPALGFVEDAGEKY